MGILEIKQPTTTEVVPPSVVMDYHTTASPEATTSAANIEISHDLKICNTSGCDTTKSDLTQTTPMFCIDIAGLWTQTRHGAQYLLSWLYKYVHPIF
ncbi:unnamed protein product [Allacma fusca]|uniref:Uncharacterized protein n=1 Tax=Allacma fusca TaxID=39272 RepID=A0A8J2KIL8_9HEXA|nr:unnamed protein product [Allacma fusca]